MIFYDEEWKIWKPCNRGIFTISWNEIQFDSISWLENKTRHLAKVITNIWKKPD